MMKVLTLYRKAEMFEDFLKFSSPQKSSGKRNNQPPLRRSPSHWMVGQTSVLGLVIMNLL